MSKQILVVDDEPDVRTFITAVLKKGGYDTVTAANGAEALQAVQARKPDLVILDLQMPFISGFTLAEEIRESKIGHPQLPLIAYTSSTEKIPGHPFGTYLHHEQG